MPGHHDKISEKRGTLEGLKRTCRCRRPRHHECCGIRQKRNWFESGSLSDRHSRWNRIRERDDRNARAKRGENQAGWVAVVDRTRQKNRTGRPLAVVVSTVKIGYRLKHPQGIRNTVGARRMVAKSERKEIEIETLNVVFGCRFAGCCTLQFSTRNAF